MRLPEVHFRLKPEVNGECLIYLQFIYNGNRLFFSFGEKIKKTDWQKSKERLKLKSALTSDGETRLNDLLDTLEDQCYYGYKNLTPGKVPSPDQLKSHLRKYLPKNNNNLQDGESDFFQFANRLLSNEIKFKNADKTANTLKTYKTVYGHLKQFEIICKYPISFDSINLEFYHKFIDFLSKRSQYAAQIKRLRSEGDLNKPIVDLKPNSIAKSIQIIKTWMREAWDMDLTENREFTKKKFAVHRRESDSVYLTEKELTHLFNFKYSSKKLEQVVDLFIFGACTSLRFSDYNNIRPENIVMMDGIKHIKMITEKTKELVIIPCSPMVLEIFKKYPNSPNNLPKKISLTNFNLYIKAAAKEAGLVETGRLSTDMNKPLYAAISSHCCRRTAVTLLYLSGFPITELRKVSGHKSERSFFKYLKITKLDSAKKLSEHFKLTSIVGFDSKLKVAN